MKRMVGNKLWLVEGVEQMKKFGPEAGLIKLIEIGNDIGYVVISDSNKDMRLHNIPCRFKSGTFKNGPIKMVSGYKITLLTFQQLINDSDLVHQD